MVAVTMSIGPVGAAQRRRGSVRAVVTFVGGANMMLGASERALALTRATTYAIVDLTRRRGSGSDCPAAPCSTFDYWRGGCGGVAKVASDAYVVNLGINDTVVVGSPGGPGYAAYGGKVDWMMRLFGGKPVFWSNLPCAIEPPARAVGCAAVNAALAAAPSRWPNLTVIDWATEANSHPEYLFSAPGLGAVHYSAVGALVWANAAAEQSRAVRSRLVAASAARIPALSNEPPAADRRQEYFSSHGMSTAPLFRGRTVTMVKTSSAATMGVRNASCSVSGNARRKRT
jgi:hypothetical protein